MTENSLSLELSSIVYNNPIFRNCPNQALARFLPHVYVRTLKANEELQQAGQEADFAYFIISGSFLVASEVAKKGGQNVHVSSGFLGQEAAIGMDTHIVTAIADEESKVLVIPKSAIWELGKYREFRQELLQSFTDIFYKKPIQPDNTLDAPAEKESTSGEWRMLVGWFLALLVPASMVSGIVEFPNIPSQECISLVAILSASIIMWVFRLLPDFVPALFSVLSVVLFGLAPADVALAGFGSKTFFMALSIFGLSAVIIVSGLSYRILLLLLKIGPANKAWYYMSLFLSGAVLTPVVPTTNGRVSIVTPFMTELLTSFDPASAKAEAPRLSAAVLGGTSLLSAVFLSSKSVNFLVFGLMPFQEQMRFQWVDWLFAASVAGLVLLVLYLLASWLLFRNSEKPSIPKVLVCDQLKILGPPKPGEWAGVIGLLVLLTSFMTAAVHHIEIPWIALAILFSLLMFGFLQKQDFRNRIDWNFLIFLGSLIGLVSSMKYVGLDKWLTLQLAWLNDYMANDFGIFIALLSLSIFVVRLAMPINATVVIFATLLMPAAMNLGITPWVVGFIILLMSEGFIWPYQASYYAQFCTLAGPGSGSESPKLIALNALQYAFKLAAIYASVPFWQYLGLL